MPNIDHASRAHALLSASGSERWLACPASVMAAELYPPQDTAFTREGTRAHEVAELVACGVADGAGLTAEDPDMVRHAFSYRDFINEHTGPDEVVLLEQRVDFSSWVPGGFGTADCVIIGDRRIKVIDYKYGAGVAVSAVGNPQMRLYALGAWSLLRDLYEIETVEMYIFQPRKDNISGDEISVADLLAWADGVVRPTAELAASGDGPYSAGAHCRFCPHAGSCRELKSHCEAVVAVGGSSFAVDQLAPWEVAEVLTEKAVITAWLKAVEERARVSILNGGEVPGFKVVEGKLGNRKWSDDIAVAEALKAAGVPLEDFTELVLLSPAAMDKSLGKKRAAELLSGFIKREPGSPALVPESDKRPPINRLADAQAAFE